MNENVFYHTPVLKEEVIESLNVKAGGKYIDATIGGGGHTEEIIKRGGLVLGIDQDAEAIEHLRKKLGEKVILVLDNFKNIEKIARNNNFADVDGVLLDIGVSSHQLDTPERGFSYRYKADLDMRMNIKNDLTAKKIVNEYTLDELKSIFEKYSELEKARELASVIVRERKKRKIETTHDLVGVIEKETHIDNATKSRIFQALRIAVNDEIEVLKNALTDSFTILAKKGRLCVISFHSLEDRIVKDFGKRMEKEKLARLVNKKPITATENEISVNRRAKSAKLRVIEKL